MKNLPPLLAPHSPAGAVRPPGLSIAARITLLLLIVMVVTFAALAWFGRQTVLDSFAAKEVELVLQNRKILEQAITAKLEFLQASTTDWAAWDDFYNFAQGRYPEFPSRHLGPAILDRLHLDMLLVVDARGGLQAGDVRSPDPGAGTDIVDLLRGAAPYAAGHHAGHPSVLPVAGSRETIAGVITTRHGPMLLALRPISRTDGSGEPAGTIVLGSYLHAEQLFSTLSVLPSQVIVHGNRRNGLSPEMHAVALALARAPGGASLVTRQEDMSDFRLFRDLAGNPAFILETRMPRTILATGRDTARALLLGLLVTVTVTLLILSTLIHAIVSAPLRRLTRHLLDLRESGELLPTPGRERRDEIGALARLFQELESARHADHARLEQLAAAVEYAGDAIAILDADGCINYVNPQYERQTGFSFEEVRGKAPASGKNAGATYADLWETVRSGRSWSGHLESATRQGSTRHEEVTVAPIRDNAGHAIGYIAVMRDITARRETEAKLRNLSAVVEYTAQSIVVLDLAGRIQYVNPAYQRNRDVRSADVVGKAPGEAIKGRDNQEYYEEMWRTVAAGRTWMGRISTELKDGRVITEDAAVSPVLGDAGVPNSYVVVLHDVTERLRLESQLAHAQKLEAVGQLAAGVAHEINTPTQYVGGNIRFLDDAFTTVTGLLAEITRLVRDAGDGFVPATDLALALSVADADYLQAEVPVAIRQSLEGVERVGEIVRSMRELSHPARNLMGTDLNRVIASAVRVAGSEWQGIAEVCTELDPGLPLVPCQAGGINQVIVNMLVNAVQAIEAGSAQYSRGSGRIVIATSMAGADAVIRITDNGSGMTEEVRAQVFHPFFTTKEVGQGTGQGLAIAHSVITKHRGSITVESEPGRGTCFTIRLPLAADATADSAAAA